MKRQDLLKSVSLSFSVSYLGRCDCGRDGRRERGEWRDDLFKMAPVDSETGSEGFRHRPVLAIDTRYRGGK